MSVHSLERYTVLLNQIMKEENFCSPVELNAYREEALKRLVYELRVHLASAPERELILSEVRHDVPADWWEAVRERWFPAWWVRRWPIKYEAIEVRRIERQIKVCPHIGWKEKDHQRWLVQIEEGVDTEERRELMEFKKFVFSLIAPSGQNSYECSQHIKDQAKALLNS